MNTFSEYSGDARHLPVLQWRRLGSDHDATESPQARSKSFDRDGHLGRSLR